MQSVKVLATVSTISRYQRLQPFSRDLIGVPSASLRRLPANQHHRGEQETDGAFNRPCIEASVLGRSV